MLSNSLGTDLHMWDPQMAALTQHFRLVRYDRRGHGKSGVPTGPYTMEMLGRDVLAVLDALRSRRSTGAASRWAAWSACGWRQRAAAREPADPVEHLGLFPRQGDLERPHQDRARERPRLIVGGTMERWFTAGFREREPKKIEWLSEMFLRTDPEGYIACGQAVRDMDHREIIKSIKAPTMVIAGKQDRRAPPSRWRMYPRSIPGASMTVFDAAHIANVEQPHDYTDAVLGFLHRNRA